MISKVADYFVEKLSYIRKLPSGKYKVYSEKGKNMGVFDSKEKAKSRLKQIEFFKHKKASKIDLTTIDDYSYSSILRKLRKEMSGSELLNFQKSFKKHFEEAYLNDVENPQKIALNKTLLDLNKKFDVKLDKKVIKNAAITELGNAEEVGRYLANIVKFTMSKISDEKRQQSINKLKYKILNLDSSEIANKKMPASAAMGNSITFIKHILFNHDPKYVRDVLESIARNL